MHHFGVKNTRLIHDIALLDARCLDDELLRRVFLGGQLSCLDLGGMFEVVQIGIGVERLDQLGVSDDLFRRKNAATSNGGCVHG